MSKTEQEKLNTLYQMLNEKEKDFERRKVKRTILTILGFAVFYFCLLFIIEEPSGWDIVLTIPSAVVIAGIHFWANGIIFGQLFQKSKDEADLLASIRKMIREIEGRKKP
jgi:ABC-type polysaccharide/polyol phosphate export permease